MSVNRCSSDCTIEEQTHTLVGTTSKFRPEQNQSIYVGLGVTLDIDLHAKGTVVVDGRVNGDIECAELIVGPTGVVNGHIAVETVDVSGAIGPSTRATRLLQVRSKGLVHGRAAYCEIEIERGGNLNAASFSSIARAHQVTSNKISDIVPRELHVNTRHHERDSQQNPRRSSGSRH